MLQPIQHILSQQRIILASGSPRRRQILENVIYDLWRLCHSHTYPPSGVSLKRTSRAYLRNFLGQRFLQGLHFEVVVSSFAEDLDKDNFEHPFEYAKETARKKTLQVATQLQSEKKRVDLIIGADTVVTMDGQIYEKPKDDEDAFRMLSRFSGRSHTVYTGVVIARPMKDGDGFDIVDFHEGTDVDFAKISPEVIRGYIKTGEPMDKDGGYGIQAKGGTLIERVNGDYFNVMGFPLHRFSRKLLDMYGDHLHWQT